MPRIAIPLPHSSDPDYAQRSIPQYERAIELAGGEPIRIPLDQPAEALLRIIESCDAVLLPGSKADVDPAKFHSQPSPHTAAADAARNAVDELLLTHAYRQRKPVLGICYGLQSLNVFRSGSLVQHIPDFLPEAVRNRVNHEAGKTVAIAHEVEIENASQLAKILCRDSRPGLSRAQLGGIATAPAQNDHSVSYAFKSAANAASPSGKNLILPVNSSHHQSAETIGHGLRIIARCPADGIIEALEGTADDHFVLAVQWHPERSVDQDEPSRTLFRAFVEAAEEPSKKR
ncbi:MAG TPA: gamma-glutamyl-gamma-aminobutyrate hydrolase family protein [Candidatus Sulfotelmatobacter sp.]